MHANRTVFIHPDFTWGEGTGDQNFRDDFLRLFRAKAGFNTNIVESLHDFTQCMAADDALGFYLTRYDVQLASVPAQKMFSLLMVNGETVFPRYTGFDLKYFHAQERSRFASEADHADSAIRYYDFLPTRVNAADLAKFKDRPPLSLGVVMGDFIDPDGFFEDIGKIGKTLGDSFGWTTSPRTLASIQTQAMQKLAAAEIGFPYNYQSLLKKNPYLEILARAQNLIVTSDSRSMLSDCLQTGKPVYVWRPDTFRNRADPLTAYLSQQEDLGRLAVYRKPEQLGQPMAGHDPIQEWSGVCDDVASAIAKKFKLTRAPVPAPVTQSLSAAL
jgi:hypothetical protein